MSALNDQFGCIDLSNNNLTKIPKLSLKNLSTLILCGNQITEFEEGWADECPNLVNLILTNNRIESEETLNNILSANLVRLSLQGNIVSYREGFRLYVIGKCPSLTILDFERVTLEEKKQAEG